MKKKIAILMAFCLLALVALCGCGGPTPTETADTFLSAIKAQDEEAIKTVYAGEDFDLMGDVSKNGYGDENDDSSDLLSGEDMTEMFMSKLLDFDYELSNEKIDGNKATVDVKITTYEIGNAFSSFMTDYFSQALTLAFSGASDEQIEKVADNILTEKFTELKSKDYTGTATLKLVKKDDVWKVAEIGDDAEFLNVLSGNMVKTLENLEEAYSFDE